MRYAEWELSQHEYARARSIFERALDVDSTNVPLWIRYIQSEIKTRNINHARNLLDRAVTILPRIDKLWFTYVQVEETLNNIPGTRQVFERWMQWRPQAPAWLAYIGLEKRYQEFDRARDLYQRFCALYPFPENWVKWANFEEEYGSVDNVREVYTVAVDTLMAAGEEFLDEKILNAFARWEAKQKEWERARAIYQFGLEKLPKSKSKVLYDAYTRFTKQYGDKDGIEDVIVAKRRRKYEDALKEDPNDYDTWFSYLTLLESASAEADDVRDVYERAIANIPPQLEKRFWRRYIFLWIRYAIYEELETKDIERTREIYKQCIKTIPHKQFSFDKVWLLYAKFEIRQGNLQAARKILGQGIGLSGKPKIYKGYILLEKDLKEFDRCRILYEKYIENYPEMPQSWIEFAQMEQTLGDIDRARAIFEMAIEEPEMEMPEIVWKKYIEFETEEEEYALARGLYERLVEKTGHVKVWISYALFEVSVPDEEALAKAQAESADDQEEEIEVEITEANKSRARAIFERAWDYFKQHDMKEERVILNETWKDFEKTYGTKESLEKIEKQSPHVVTKTRKLEDGSLEEYTDYIFPTDAKQNNLASFLANAKKWKMAQEKKE